MWLKRFTLLLGILLVAIGVTALTTVYTVDEREYAVVLMFGRPVAERLEAGLYFKLPLVQTVKKFPRTRQLWGAQLRYVLPDLPTADGKKIEVIPWAIWRITSPEKFVQRVGSMQRAEALVADFVRGAIRDVLTQHKLIDIVRSTDRELTYRFGEEAARAMAKMQGIQLQRPTVEERVSLGRDKITKQIIEELQRQLAGEGDRGFEIVDVGIMKIDFVPDVRVAAFRRLAAFMESIAAFYREDGERIKQEILNRTKAEVARIEAEGKRDAARIRGEAEAEAIRLYAKAIRQAGDFYTLLRTLEAYENSFSQQTQLLLTTDSEFFRILNRLSPAPQALPPSPPVAEKAEQVARPPEADGAGR